MNNNYSHKTSWFIEQSIDNGKTWHWIGLNKNSLEEAKLSLARVFPQSENEKFRIIREEVTIEKFIEE
ncbi:MAG: hypothetical protein FMNOHCHN_02066 [Ignavibacteriaceae bacterium]|nr:hypothetical protein [Ignavibacteriaceae bacterium]